MLSETQDKMQQNMSAMTKYQVVHICQFLPKCVYRCRNLPSSSSISSRTPSETTSISQRTPPETLQPYYASNFWIKKAQASAQFRIKMKKGKSEKDLYRIPKKIDNSKNYCKLIIVIVMSVVFIGGEILGGVISHSISVISDATHLITDLVGFIVSFVFLYYSDRASNSKNSFGFHRMEVIGALANLFIIWCIAVFLFYEATMRIINMEFVEDPKVMLIVAGAGLGINIIMYFVLHTGSGHSHGLGQKCDHDDSAQEEMPLCKSCQEPEGIQHQCKSINDMLNDEVRGNKPRKGESEQQISSIHLNEGVQPIEMVTVKTKQLPPLKKPAKHSHNHDHDHDHQHGHSQQHKHDHSDPNHKCSGSHEHNPESKNKHQEPHVQNPSDCTGSHEKCRKESHDSCDHDNGHDHDHGHGHGHSHHGHDHDQEGEVDENQQSISMKAAILHALTDVIQSIGLLISALVIYFVGSDNGAPVTEFNPWHYLDPVTTYVFSVLVIISTWPITKQCYHIILEATPEQIDSQKLRQQFSSMQGVKQIHDFHVWQLRPTKILLTAHVFSDRSMEKKVLHRLTTLCRRYKIYHTTIQVEEWESKGSDEYVKCENDIH